MEPPEVHHRTANKAIYLHSKSKTENNEKGKLLAR